jgi:hypothetical protein
MLAMMAEPWSCQYHEAGRTEVTYRYVELEATHGVMTGLSESLSGY